MHLHNPQNLKLPPFRWSKKQSRMDLEEDEKVRNLIQLKSLLDPRLNQLLSRLRTNTELIANHLHKIQTVCEEFQCKPDEFDKAMFALSEMTKLEERNVARQSTVDEIIRAVNLKKNDELITIALRLLRKHNVWHISQIVRFSNEMQNLLAKFERLKRAQLEILSNSTFYVCKLCSAILVLDRFQPRECICGKKYKTPSTMTHVPVYALNSQLIAFLNNNSWLEHGVSQLFQGKGFTTMCGVYILGCSGVQHEIDNVAERAGDNLRIICECKNCDVTINDVLLFSAKMADIGITRGYIFTTGSNLSPDVKRLARAKSIGLVSSLLHKPQKELLREIEN